MPTHLVPPACRDAVRHALREAFGTETLDDLTPLRAGLSSALVCRAVVAGRPWLLRVETARDGFRDPVRQYACLAVAARAGLAPAVRYADAQAGVAIMDFIEVRPAGEYPGGTPAMALELAGMLARLQRTPVFPRLVDYFDGMEAVIANSLATGAIDGEALSAPLAAYREIRDAYPRLGQEAWVSSHNDLNPSNVLYDGVRLWLVDWESAFAADPQVDVAMAANWFGVQGEAEGPFLKAAFGEVDAARQARFAMMRQVCNTFYACMMANLATMGGSGPIADLAGPGMIEVRQGLGAGTLEIGTATGQAMFAKAAFREVLAFARSPAFALAARVLA